MPPVVTAGYRVSYVWQQQSTLATGWTENFWNIAGSIDQVVAQAKTLLPLLNAIHGAQGFTNYTRIGAYPRSRRIKGTSYPTAAPGTDLTNDADFPTTALLISLQDADRNFTQQWIKGIPDDVVKNAGRYTPGGTFPDLATAFFAKLRSGVANWAIRILNPANEPKPITSIIAATGVVTAPGHGFISSGGQPVRVRVSGVDNYKFANGVHNMAVVDVNTLQYTKWIIPVVSPVTGSLKTVRLLSYVFKPIDDGKIERVTKRNVGRPTRVLSGHRKAAKNS